MNSSRPAGFFKFVLTTTFVAALVLVFPAAAQRPFAKSPARVPITYPDAANQQTVAVMVEMKAAPAATMYAEALKVAQQQADSARNYALTHPNLRTSQALLKQKPQPVQISPQAANQVRLAIQNLDQAQRQVLPALTGGTIQGKVMYRVQRAYNGVAMYVRADKISEIAKLPGVKAVHRMRPKYMTGSFSDIDFLGTRPTWIKPPGVHGENIKVAIIDTGLDYIHTNFGGPGSSGYPIPPNHTSSPNAFFPTPKVPGGYDFAGDAYDGGNAPAPDPDPFDCNGHGTSCASLAAGYGVTNAGFTYSGTYDSTNPVMANLSISPGFAPNAKLYPVRVFGCTGGTNLVIQALEWTMDPNGDGNFSDRMDIASMSLGAGEGFADDPDDVAVSNAAAAGINVCSAAGNKFDTFYIQDTPGSASGGLSVAASFNDQNGFISDSSVTGNSPPAIAGSKFASVYSDASPQTSLTDNVVYARPANGSTAFTNAAQVSGNIVLIDRGTVTFAVKAANAQAAGASGIIMVNNAAGDPFVQGGTGAFTNGPNVMISLTDGNAIKAAAAFDATTGVPVNPTNVTIAPDSLTVTRATNPPGSAAGAGSPDTPASYTSRGPRMPDSALKPDLTAPAEVVGVAKNNTGNLAENFNGTSSATPHVAGILALLKQLHPTWTVQEINALICEGATHDIATTVGGATKIGPGRSGVGRVDVTNSGNANVVAYNGTDPNLIGVSFGVVEVPVDGSKSLTKQIRVTNKGATSVTYNITYQDSAAASGASFILPASVTVPAASTTTFNVTFSATGSALRHDHDASVTETQATAFFTAGRQYLTEKAGYAVLTPTVAGSEPTIRVALYAAPKPSSSMHATVTGVVPDAASGSFSINLSGAGINTGASFPTDIVSLVKAFELQYISPLAGSANPPTDPNVIKYVGVTSDWANRSAGDRSAGATVVTFAIEGFGNSPIPKNFGDSDKRILIDFDFDTVTDATIYMTALPNASNTAVGTNVYWVGYSDDANLYGFGAGATFFWDQMVNGITPGSFVAGAATNRDVNTFNNSVVHLPVDFIVGTGATSFNYQVVTFNRSGSLIDQSPVLYFDAALPGIDTTPAATFEPFAFSDLPATIITANYNGTNYQTNASKGVLLTHRHNGTGSRSDVVILRKPTITSFSPTHGKVGSQVTITGSNFGPGTVVKFTSNKTAVVNVITSTTLVATVPAGAVTGPIRASNAAGVSVGPGVFTVDP